MLRNSLLSFLGISFLLSGAGYLTRAFESDADARHADRIGFDPRCVEVRRSLENYLSRASVNFGKVSECPVSSDKPSPIELVVISDSPQIEEWGRSGFLQSIADMYNTKVIVGPETDRFSLVLSPARKPFSLTSN